MAALPAPPFDAELAAALTSGKLPPDAPLQNKILPIIRTAMDSMYTAENSIGTKKVTHTEKIISGPHGPITLSIFAPSKPATAPRPGVYFIHGGGMVIGNRFIGGAWIAEWAEELDAVAVSVEYRLAPEHPYPVPLDDCYTGLEWLGANVAELGIDPARILLAGQSAGGGLSAALALRVRDQGGPKLAGLCLQCPMLDDRNNSHSVQQFPTVGLWSGAKNHFGWTALLGEERGKEGVSPYAAPARCEDLSGLPPVYLDVGSAEPFRDEVVAFAGGIWKVGGVADLHVWAGGYHGFDMMVPDADISIKAKKTRTEWVAKVLR